MRFCILVFIVVLFAHFALFAQWTRTNGPNGGMVTSVISMDNILYAGTYGGGVFRSTDNGSNWEKTGLVKEDIRLFAHDNQYIYAGGDGIYRSSDKGISWEEIYSGLRNVHINAIHTNGKYIFIATFGGVYRSDEHGKNWELINNGLPKQNVTTMKIMGQYLYAGTYGGGIFRSKNNGNDWYSCGLNTMNISGMINHNNYLYVTIPNGRIFKCSDNEENLNIVELPSVKNGITALTSDGHNIYIGYNDSNGVYRSSDNGNSWVSVSDSWKQTSVYNLIIDTEYLYAVTFEKYHSKVFRSSNQGKNWETVKATNIYTYSFTIMNEFIYAGTMSDGGSLYRSSDQGKNWDIVNSGVLPPHFYALANDGKNIYAGGTMGINCSSDNGEIWKDCSDVYVTGSHVTTIAIDEQYVYVGTKQRGMFQMLKQSGKWEEINKGLTLTDIHKLAIDYENKIYAGTSGGLFFSKDKGKKWEIINLMFDTVTALVTDRENIYIAERKGGVYHSIDQGRSWRNIGLSDKIITSMLIDEKSIYVGTINGLFRSSNQGETWENIDANLKNKEILAICIKDRYLFASIYGNGVWKLDLQNNASSQFSFDIAPNPTNDNVLFSIQNYYSDLPISLEIYTLHGEKVFEDILRYSSYNLETDNLPSGLYYCFIGSGQNFDMKVLSVMK